YQDGPLARRRGNWRNVVDSSYNASGLDRGRAGGRTATARRRERMMPNDPAPDKAETEILPSIPPAPHHSATYRLRNYFLTGLIVAGPLAITVYLTWSFITWVDNFVRPFIPIAYRPETYLPWSIPGTGLVIAFFAITMLGFLTANLVGRTLVEA